MKKALFAILLSLLSFNIALTNATADEARDAFKSAKIEFRKENYPEAARLFRRAYDLKPSWKLLYNVGQAEAAAKRYGLALEAFERYIAEGGDDVPVKRQGDVHKEIARLRDIVGILKVQTHDGAEISVDGMLRGTAPIYGGIPVSAGVEHTVTVVFEGEMLPQESVKVLGGRTVELTIMTDKDSPPAEERSVVEPVSGETSSDGKREDETVEKTATDVPPRSGKNVVGIAMIVTGASLVVGGAASGAVALMKNSDLEGNCTDGVCPDGFEDTERTRNITGITAAALLGAGGVTIVVGVVLLSRSRKDGKRIGVQPMIGPQTAGASLSLAF